MNLPMIVIGKGTRGGGVVGKGSKRVMVGKNGSTRVRTGDPHYVKVM